MTTTLASFSRRVAPSIAVSIGSATLPACIHSEAAQVRGDKPLSVGFVGMQIRPVSSVGVGVGIDALTKLPGAQAKQTIRSGGRDVRATSAAFSYTPYVNVFPFDTSHFFLGAGLQSLDSRSSVEVDGSTYRYSTRARYLSPAVGWNWIWKSGFSLFLDLGVRVRIARSRDEGGLTTQAARSAADAWDDEYVAPVVGVGGGGSGLLGWSFGV